MILSQSRGWRRAFILASPTLILGMAAGMPAAHAVDSVAEEPPSASAEPETPHSYPYVKGDLFLGFQANHTFAADNRDAKVTDVFNKTELGGGLYLTPNFSVHGGFTLEPVFDPGPGEDRFFGDEGLYVQQLYGQADVSSVAVFAGKFNLAFGKAWDVAPDPFGGDIVEDYQFTERVGMGFSVARDKTPIGKVTLTASTFFADVSVLSNSLFTSRGQTSTRDGGLSNTGSLDSFVISLAGSDVPGLEGVNYNLGFIHQAGGVNDISDQNGFVAGLNGTRKFKDFSIDWMAEGVYFDYGGDLYDTDTPSEFVDKLWYWTLGATVKYEKYRAALAYTARNAELFDGRNFDDYQVQFSVGTDLPDDWAIDVGYKFLHEQDEDSHVIGVKLARKIEFDTGALEKPKAKAD